MSIDRGDLGSFGDLAVALGLLSPDTGDPNAAWFTDPVSGGAGPNAHGLKYLLADDAQRAALLHFVDQVLGPPDAPVRDAATWVPLFAETDPHVTIYAVVSEVDTEVRVGIALEHTTANSAPPTISTSVHVPLFRFSRRGSSLSPGDPPDWLLLGRDGGDIEIAVDTTLRAGPPPPGTAGLGGASLGVTIPTSDTDVAFSLTLRDLQLPGAGEPQTFTLDLAHPDQLGQELLDLLSGLIRAEADALGSALASDFAPFAALAGLLGLRDVTHLPPLPLSDLPTRGVRALVDWVEGVLADHDARDAWLGQLASLIGSDASVDPVRDAVVLTLGTGVGQVVIRLGVAVTPGTGGHPLLVPWAEASYASRTGVLALAHVDLLRVDTGTGGVLAVPDARLEAVFGADAGGGSLVDQGHAFTVGSLHVGVALDDQHRPAFVLTAADVWVDGAHRDLIDLSTPDAALAAGADLVTAALQQALSDLGDAGDLVARLLGVTATGGVGPISVPGLVADPVGTIKAHWQSVLASSAAAQDLLGRLSALVRGAAPAIAPGGGTQDQPWQVSLVDGVRLDVWLDGSIVHVDAAATVARPVLDTLQLSVALSIAMATLDLAQGHATFANGASLSAALGRSDAQPTVLQLGDVALRGTELAVEASWLPAAGVRVRLRSDDLALAIADTTVPIPLPQLDKHGALTLPDPDWSAVETALMTLLGEVGIPELQAGLDLLGWTGGGPHLALADLLSGNQHAVTVAIEAWLADLLLDCDVVRRALGPVASLLSGFSLSAPLGSGRPEDPFRCPVAGEPRAPGLRVWLDPGCAPHPDPTGAGTGALTGSTPPTPEVVAAALRRAGLTRPDLADLLVGRDSLDVGLGQLLTRWTGTDGLVGKPDTMPADVSTFVVDGVSYAELAALGRSGALAGRVLTGAATVVHVGTEAEILIDRPSGTTFDLTTDGPPPALPSGAGPWFVRVPSPAVAALARPDRGGVGEQAARLVALLESSSGSLALLGYADAAAAVVRAAASVASVSEVVTVGGPWADTSYLTFSGGYGGDALQLLRRLQIADLPVWPDPLLGGQCTPLQRVRLLVQRSLTTLDPTAALPRVDTETRRTGLTVHAVFGALDTGGLQYGVGAFAADAVDTRTPAPSTDPVTENALHVAVDLPILDLDLGGLLVGAGAAFEVCQVARGGDGLTVALARSLAIELHLGVHDGWLVGGPDSGSDSGDLRWLGIKVLIPLDGSTGSTALVLHDMQALGVDHEVLVVDASGVAPEVRVVIADVVARLRTADPSLATLLSRFGLVDGAGSFDATGLDRLVHDPGVTLHTLVAAAPADIAGALRALVPGATGSGTSVAWGVGPGSVGVDLATGSWTVGLDVTGEGLLPVSVAASMASGAAYATVGIGALDPQLGGTRLVLATPRDGARASIAVEWAGPGSTTSTAGIWPTLDADPCVQLLTTLLPSVALELLLSALLTRTTGAARDALTSGLTVCGLLQPRTDGGPELRLPLAFVRDPAAHLIAAVRRAEADVAATAVQLLESMAHLVEAAPPGDGTWPIADGVTLQYSASGGALTIGLHAALSETLDGVVVTSNLTAGVVLRPGVLPAPAVDVSVLVGEVGLELALDPGLRVNLLRAAPRAPLPLYPTGPGLGQAFATAAATLVPELLNRVAALGGTSTGLPQKVGLLVGELGDALDLRDAGQFTGARITTFAGDPSGALLSHLPVLVGQATASLVDALNGSPARATVTQQPGRATITFGTAPDTVSVTLDTTGSGPAVELAASWLIPDVGPISVDVLRFSAAGVTVGATLGPFPVQAGPVRLAPLLVVLAGTGAAASDRLLGIGLALDDLAHRSVEVRWSLDAQPPKLVAVDRGTTPLVSEAGATPRLLSLGVGLAGGIVVQSLPTGFLDARAIRILHGVLFTETATTPELDPQVVLDLLDPGLLVARVERLLWNAATDAQPLQVTIGGQVTIGLVATDADGGKDLGVELTLASGQRFKLADDDTVVELEVDGTWIDPAVAPGISIYAVHGVRTADTFAFTFRPGVTVGGVGLRFTKQSGPLLSLGAIGIDGFAVRVYAEARAAGVGGGVQVALLGLAVAPGGAGGNNTVANGIMGDAGKSSAAQRPAFSPALAVQAHPTTPLGVSLRAGDPPGPWWVVVQRQLGPLYVERVGFDEAEANGTISRIALLFDGSVSLFGLTAAVDQLSITWLGGDPFDAHQWAVDLMGLAVSADMSGVTLAGGLLKTVDAGGDPAYVGMLLGKFGIYGLSVFGGYTSLGGAPSFFVFGAFNGPIGGPPAFFLTGIGGGLGINRKLVAPTDAANIDQFPFVQALDPYAQVPDPMTELKNLSIDFPPELGNFWFAAGISFTCFCLVDGVAVVAVSFGDGLEIDLLGLARMALPAPGAALVSIELGLLARFSTTEGLFLIQASLTDNSWLLYEDVRLTGGFAFATWWKGPLAGQFVLTIGGYHPDFHVDGYPVVPRLGLSWQVSDDISIKGGSYFALTSEAVMAGIGVDAVADFGWAWARASFGADGLVYYDPFWYDVDVRATISAGVDIDTWLGTISFSVTTGCEVHVWGPDFSGEATVEVGPCSVSIPFGSDAKREGKVLGWSDFVAKYLEDAGDGAARALSAITGRGSLPASTGGGASAPTPDGSLDRPFEVYAEFDLTVVTTMPTSVIALGGRTLPFQVARSDSASAALGLSPMHATVSESRMSMTLELFSGGAWQADQADLDQLGAATATSSFPIGVWGAPTGTSGQTTPDRLPSGDVIEAGSQLTLTAAATGQATGPEIDYYRVEAGTRRPLPFAAQSAQRLTLQQSAGQVPPPQPGSVASAVATAAELLFATPVAEQAGSGILRSGARSELARAGYRGSIAAPPLFGNLTDGLAVDNASDVASAPLPPPPVPPAPLPQQPRMIGYLSAGAMVAFRQAGTTVSDAETKRRTAPTLASVQARLGAHLPINLDVSVPAATTTTDGTAQPTRLPFSGIPSSARTFRLADVGSRVAGLSALGGPVSASKDVGSGAAAAGGSLLAGDVVVLDSPDHGVDTAESRPTVDLGGSARVTAVRGDGRVLLDAVRSGAVEVPAGTALLAVQADGVVDGLDGCAGWHLRSTVARVGARAALAAGAVVVVESGLMPGDSGWASASALVRGAARVLTRFSSLVHTVAIVVESDTPERVSDLGLQLQGATRATGPDGRVRDPRLVLHGVQAVAVYDVVPDPLADTVAVSVAPGGGWHLSGVLGTDLAAAELTNALVADGLVAVTSRLAAVTGPGCSPTWHDAASAPKTVRAKKKTATKKTTAKKAATKKATAKKTAAKKTATKKTSTKKTSTKKGGRRGR